MVGPNGRGKTTLLKHIGNRALRIPKHIDVLYCEQEVQADETPAIEAVLSADVKRTDLIAEQKKVMSRFERGDMNAQTRMMEIDEELIAIGAESAEGRARRILSGLGFTRKMQERATKGRSHNTPRILQEILSDSQLKLNKNPSNRQFKFKKFPSNRQLH